MKLIDKNLLHDRDSDLTASNRNEPYIKKDRHEAEKPHSTLSLNLCDDKISHFFSPRPF